MKLTMCEVILYEEHYPTIQEIQAIAESYKSIKKYAIIKHDKDGIKTHYHVALHFGTSYETDRLVKMFHDLTLNMISKIKGSWSDVLKYLTHSNAKDKHQYQLNEVLSNFDLEIDMKADDRKKTVQEMIIQYSNTDIGYHQLWNFLTPTERLKYNRTIKEAVEIRNVNIKMKGSRNMEVYYITGSTGSGKTTLAKYLAEKVYKMSYYVSSSSNDPLQDYMGQEVIILDDLRGDSFTFTDLLKMLDNHTQTSVKSRYYNKAIDCKKIIITSIKQVFELYPNTTIQDEPFKQLLRRINEYIDIDENGKIYTKMVDWDVYHTTGVTAWTNRKALGMTVNEMIEFYQAMNQVQKSLQNVMAEYVKTIK